MPDEVTLDVTTIEENVTVETTAGDVVEIQVVAPTGPAGATGPAGPNSVTIATTSDGTANLSLGDLEVVGGEIYTDGDYSQIYTQGTDAHIFTLGSGAEIFTVGAAATIATQGENATISTVGANAGISTSGANATMGTLGANAIISTAGSAAHIQTTHASAAVKSTNFAAVESGGASLVDGSMQPCLTWSAGGRNLTIPSGTATTFNTTSYTYGTGAAAAHRTALGLTTLATTTAGTNVANFLEFPTSANLASALTDENGTGGGFVRAEGATLTSPSLVGPVNLTSQDASTADRVMTRALGDARHGVIASVVLPSTQTVTNSTTLTGVTGGSVTLEEGTWHIRCCLMVGAASTTPGIKADINISGLGVNVTGKTYISGFSSIVTLTTQNPIISAVSNLCSLNEAGATFRNIEFSGIIVLPTSRTLQMRIAQRTSSSDAVSIWQGSHFVATRIA